ncbi:MAG: 4Fe-4S dicluster domain-containing protein [Bacteroidetes bacterium]|nr:4Fe-4S dicluster domain-containing protein [Bacteroidota bacterium]
MSYRVNSEFKSDLKKFGIAEQWNECFHCGNCTAVCPLTENGFLFPRQGIRVMQMGLKEKLATYVDPWLCYYCGECSETCPREANPAELMMTLRRYLTSVYDWTGLSKKIYTSKWWEFGSIIIIALLIIVGFLIYLPLKSGADAMVNQSGSVMINSLVEGISAGQFVRIIEIGDWTMAIIVAALLISNILNMFYKVILSDNAVKVPFGTYFTEFWRLIYNFATQAKFSKCDDRNYWVGHLLLMTGYSIMFALVVIALPLFQIEEIVPWYNWQRLLGYYATFGILFFLIQVTIGRIKKQDTKLKFSHPSDWLFIIMLALTTITGILVHIFRLNGMVEATYYLYIAHLAVLVPMIVIEVPFSKWSHLAYRPFAVYFSRLKKAAVKKIEYQRELAPAI